MIRKRITVIILSLYLLSLFSHPILAQEEPTATPSGDEPKQSIKEIRKNFQEQKKAALEEYKASVKELRTNFHEIIKQKREEATLSARAKKEAFKQKLSLIKDSFKKQLTERIDDKLQKINTHRTEMMAKALEKMSAILNKVEQKVINAKASGKDTANAEKAIADAKTAIGNAQNAISQQASKTYVINITTESNLKNNVGAQVSALQADLKATHRIVIAAKQAIANAIREAALVIGEKIGNTPIVSTTLTPTPTAAQNNTATESAQ